MKEQGLDDIIEYKDKKDLRKKLLKGIKDTDNGNVCTIDEAFSEVEAILR
jgi:hypothetical protein